MHLQENTLIMLIYDLVPLNHRTIDDANLWSFSEDEVKELKS